MKLPICWLSHPENCLFLLCENVLCDEAIAAQRAYRNDVNGCVVKVDDLQLRGSESSLAYVLII